MIKKKKKKNSIRLSYAGGALFQNCIGSSNYMGNPEHWKPSSTSLVMKLKLLHPKEGVSQKKSWLFKVCIGREIVRAFVLCGKKLNLEHLWPSFTIYKLYQIITSLGTQVHSINWYFVEPLQCLVSWGIQGNIHSNRKWRAVANSVKMCRLKRSWKLCKF